MAAATSLLGPHGASSRAEPSVAHGAAGRGRPAGAPVRLATRRSPLARWQAERVAELLRSLGDAPPVEIVPVETTGDRLATVSLAALGGQGVFVTEVQDAVRRGAADLAVHSAKDLPAATPEGLVVAAVPERADPRDVLVGGELRRLRPGALVATGSPRRRSQLAAARPDLRFADLRGNIGTRLGRVGEVDAVVVAAAALERLGMAGRATEVLAPSVVLPQVAQGALAVECRRDDQALRDLLARIEDRAARRAVDAERAFLAAAGGGCRAPLGALARGGPDGPLTLQAMVASHDGHVVLRCTVTGTDPAALGRAALDDLVERRGAALVLGPGDWR